MSEGGSWDDVLPSNVRREAEPPEDPRLAPYHTVPASPTITESYGHGWRQLRRYFLELFLAGLVAFVVQIACSAVLGALQAGMRQNPGSTGLASLLQLAYQFLIGTPLSYGLLFAFLRAARGETPQVSDLLEAFRRGWVESALAGLLTTVLIVIGFFLLIIPGVILSVRLSFVPFLVVDERFGPVGAVRESWRRSAGYGWTIFGFWLLSIPIFLVGFLLLIIGVIPALMWVWTAFASLYAAITVRQVRSREWTVVSSQ